MSSILNLWVDMGLIKEALLSIKSLILSEDCMVCGGHVTSSMHGICPMCRYTIPMTRYWLTEQNPVKEHLDGLAPIEQASSFFFFSANSTWRGVIHQFKYYKMWRTAYAFGRWFGSELHSSPLYADVDIVVPVPLHPLRLFKREYNQSAYLARGIARMLGVECDVWALRRRRNNPSQARRSYHARWDGMEGLFAVKHADRLRGKHILLVDDVLTTGATICSCVAEIKSCLPDCRVSVVTLAVTRKILKE